MNIPKTTVVAVALLALVACSKGEQESGTPNLYSQFNAQQPNKVETSGLSERIDLLYAKFDTANQPGCAVGVLRDGRYVHAKGYGSANIEHTVPLDLNSVFRTGSLSKQFTAHAIAMLAVREELDLDADIHTYLPELVEYPHPVTVRQVVHHVSGMADYGDGSTRFEVSSDKPFRFGNEDYWTEEEFFAQVARQPLELKPGTEFKYSNLGYYLLSQVVEQVSGMTLGEFAKREIFTPLDMSQTFFNENVNQTVANRANGYRQLVDGTFERFETNLSWVGDGGLYTSLTDFAKWDRAFVSGNVPGGEQVLKLVTEPDALSGRTMSSMVLEQGAGYAYGLEVGQYKGHSVHMHTGAWVGYRSFYVRFTDDGFSVVGLCNRSDGRPRESILSVMDETLAWFTK